MLRFIPTPYRRIFAMLFTAVSVYAAAITIWDFHVLQQRQPPVIAEGATIPLPHQKPLSFDPNAERVRKIVIEHLGVEPEKVTAEARFVDDLGADSLDAVELVMAFEVEFGCVIPDEIADRTKTVGDIVRYMQKASNSA